MPPSPDRQPLVSRESALDFLTSQIARQQIAAAKRLPPVSEDLDPDQQAAVESRERTVRILAPAGAGKTHCMVNRVLSAMRDGMAPGRILLLSFDRNAKGELKARLDRMLGSRGAPAVFTLNAFGAKLLERFSPAGRRPSLMPAGRGFSLMRPVVDRHRKGRDVQGVMPEGVSTRFYLDLVSLLKNQACYADATDPELLTTEVAHALGAVPSEAQEALFARVRHPDLAEQRNRMLALAEIVASIFLEYEVAKRKSGNIDFDDQKLDAYRLLSQDGEKRRMVQQNYQLMIVDEFQDLNELDFRLILLIAEQSGLVVVGDDDQAIYGFRATSPRYILDFEELSGRETKTVILRRNYRCPANLVKHASALIAKNTDRVEKHPVPARSVTCEIRVYNPPTADAEAAAIAVWIERIIDRTRPETLRDVAVIYRYNAQSLAIQLELIAHDIPYYCREEDNLSGQKVLGRVVGVLKYITAVQTGRGPDLTDFLTTVWAYFPRLDDRQQREIAQVARRTPQPYLDTLTSGPGDIRSTDAAEFRSVIAQLANTPGPAEVVDLIAGRFHGAKGMAGGLDDAMNGELPLGELSRIASRYSTLSEFTGFLCNAIARAGELGSDTLDGPRVRLITYFRSKGQQFGTVILPTLNAGQIPSWRSPEEDERRLFYVGVTRATQNLWLSYVDEICGHPVRPSQFLAELELPPASFVTAPAAPVRAPELWRTSKAGASASANSIHEEEMARERLRRARPPEDDFQKRYLASLRERQPLKDR